MLGLDFYDNADGEKKNQSPNIIMYSKTFFTPERNISAIKFLFLSIQLDNSTNEML